MNGASDKLRRLAQIDTAILRLPAITLLWRTLADRKRGVEASKSA
jgi:hypothetical protein